MPEKNLITDADVRAAAGEGRTQLAVSPKTIITPLARDAARDLGVEIVRAASIKTSAEPSCNCAREAPVTAVIAIGSDHGGFEMKSELTLAISELGQQILDVGTHSQESCDYPDFAYAVARAVTSGHAMLGIMIDGAGPGSAMACNKVPGIRAACVHDEFTAWNARAHNDANVITIGSRGIGIEVARRLVQVFLETPFEGGRHARRVEKLGDIERRFLQK